MDLDLYLAFLLATTALILIPGPNVTLLVANGLAHGPRRALITLAGTSSAIALQLLVVALGMSSLILLLARWFEWLRWAGVAYLIYLGVQQWRAPPLALHDLEGAPIRWGALFWRGVLVSATNPKTLVFYAAFLPQFVDPATRPDRSSGCSAPPSSSSPRCWMAPTRFSPAGCARGCARAATPDCAIA